MSDNSNLQESTIGIVSINGDGDELDRAASIPLFDLGLSSTQAKDLVLSGKDGVTFAVGSVNTGKITFLKNFMMHIETPAQQPKNLTDPTFFTSVLDTLNSTPFYHFQRELRTSDDFLELFEAKEKKLPFFSTIHADTPIMAIKRLQNHHGTESLIKLLDNDFPCRFIGLKLHRKVSSDNSISFEEAINRPEFSHLTALLSLETLGAIVKRHTDKIRVNLPLPDFKRNPNDAVAYLRDHESQIGFSVVAELMIVDPELRGLIAAGDIDSLNHHYSNQHRFNSEYKSSGIPIFEMAFFKLLNGQFCANEYARLIMPYDDLEDHLTELKKIDPTNALFGTLE